MYHKKNNIFKRTIEIFSWIYELKDKKVLKADIFAGITVAIILIPQAMAYANLAGLPAYIGLYTAFLPVIIGGILSSSRQLSTGPVTIISLMTATALATLGLNPSEYIMYASILAILMGLMQLILGFLRLGSIFNFLSHSVIIGFVNAAAILILLTQIEKLIGVDVSNGQNIFENVLILINAIINETNIYTFSFGISGIISLYILHRFFPKIPRFLFVVIISIIISYLIGFENMGGSVVGYIPAGLPSFYLPNLDIEIIKQLIGPALVIGFLGFTEAISIAKAIGLETKKQVSTNQMLYSEGMANIVSGFSSGYPVSGTFSRSAVNLKAGAKTPFASVVTGLIIGIVLLFFTSYLYHLPNAILAAVIIIAVLSLIKIEPIYKSWKIQKSDAIVSISTFFATIYFSPNLEYGIFVGIGLSIIFYLFQSMKPRFSRLALYKDGVYRDAALRGLKISKKVGVYRLYGRLFFINIRYFEEKLMKEIKENKHLKVIIIDFELIPYVDYSAMEVLESIIISLEKSNIKVYFAGVKRNLREQFKVIGYLEKFGKQNVFPKLSDIIKHLDKTRDDLDLEALLEYSPILRAKKSDK